MEEGRFLFLKTRCRCVRRTSWRRFCTCRIKRSVFIQRKHLQGCSGFSRDEGEKEEAWKETADFIANARQSLPCLSFLVPLPLSSTFFFFFFSFFFLLLLRLLYVFIFLALWFTNQPFRIFARNEALFLWSFVGGKNTRLEACLTHEENVLIGANCVEYVCLAVIFRDCCNFTTAWYVDRSLSRFCLVLSHAYVAINLSVIYLLRKTREKRKL